MGFLSKLKSAVIQWGRMSTTSVMILHGGRPFDANYDPNSGQAQINSIVIATIRWLQRNFTEAPIVFGQYDGSSLVQKRSSRLYKLLRKPNNYYSWINLWKATVADYVLTGNAYWIKQRGGRFGEPETLWWVPSFMVSPVGNPDNPNIFIDHYEYKVNNKTINYAVSDIIHFRDGFDPDNIRLGLSPFKALLREVMTDNEASVYTYSLLSNMGVPGVIISPGKDAEIGDPEKIKQDFKNKTSGKNRGEPLVMTGPINVQPLSFNPNQMSLRDMRKLPEERVTAVIGVPAVVVGMGAGLDRSTFANFGEAREAAYESCLIPMQSSFAADLNTQLRPDFYTSDDYEIYFDISQVRVLQPDVNALHVRARGDLLVGGISFNEFRKDIGKPPVKNGDTIWFVPNGVTVQQAQSPGMAQPIPTDPNPNPNDTQQEMRVDTQI